MLLDQDLKEFFEDNRCSKHHVILYAIYHELENSANLDFLDACKRKATSFTSSKLTGYIDDRYYDLTGQMRIVLLLGF